MAEVEIVSWYTCGRRFVEVANVRNPVPGEAAEDWWDNVVFPLTGDAEHRHPGYEDEYAVYTATITKIDDPYFRAGDSKEWTG